MAAVKIAGVQKWFGSTHVIRGVDVAIADGEFCVLVGPSGCGKSTLLRMIAGLEEITHGEVSIGNNVVNRMAPKERDIAMVFQNYALYPHMTVRENMSFALALAKHTKADIDAHVKKAADILGLAPYLDRYPRQLSGGQRQRVAMGRAIVRDPQVFLFDEPLSNLDAKLRVQMRTEIKELHQRLKTTSIYVTHDQIEAMTMADKIVVMKDGLVEQTGGPLELYDRPANLFVAGFIGSPAMNIIPGTARIGAAAPTCGFRRRRDAAAADGRTRRRRPVGDVRHPSRALRADGRRRLAVGGRRGRADGCGHAVVLPVQRPGSQRHGARSRRLPARRPDRADARLRPGASFRRGERCPPRGMNFKPGIKKAGPTTEGGVHDGVQASQISENDRGSRRRSGRRPVNLGQGRERTVEQRAREGCQAARIALEPVRPGRHRPIHGQCQEVHRKVRNRGARR